MQVKEQDLINFVYHEARLLDERKFVEWLDLFTDDALYWMPLEWDQEDDRLMTSLMHEDLLQLRVRVERLEGERTFSQKPKSRSQHLLQVPQVDLMNEAENTYETWTSFHYAETRFDEQQILAGWARHTLCVDGDKLKIRRKRVDLVNCDAPFRNIQLFI